jgi:hypothetical protein
MKKIIGGKSNVVNYLLINDVGMFPLVSSFVSVRGWSEFGGCEFFFNIFVLLRNPYLIKTE